MSMWFCRILYDIYLLYQAVGVVVFLWGLSGRSVRSSQNGVSLRHDFSRLRTSRFVTSTNDEGNEYDDSGEGRPESIWPRCFAFFIDLKASVNVQG